MCLVKDTIFTGKNSSGKIGLLDSIANLINLVSRIGGVCRIVSV